MSAAPASKASVAAVSSLSTRAPSSVTTSIAAGPEVEHQPEQLGVLGGELDVTQCASANAVDGRTVGRLDRRDQPAEPVFGQGAQQRTLVLEMVIESGRCDLEVAGELAKYDTFLAVMDQSDHRRVENPLAVQFWHRLSVGNPAAVEAGGDASR